MTSKMMSSKLAIQARNSRISLASTSPIIIAEVLVNDWNIVMKTEELLERI